MIRRLTATLFALLCLALPALADAEAEVRAAYDAFVADQNTRDPDLIRRHLIEGPDLLWVSDGKSFWGADEILARMTGFQKAAVWRVEPETGRARVVLLDPATALFHMPLTLVIGAAENPSRLRFLVSLVWVRQDAGWKLAALLTTTEKP
jgi:uncharacterized protein (TIGR02246 family)